MNLNESIFEEEKRILLTVTTAQWWDFVTTIMNLTLVSHKKVEQKSKVEWLKSLLIRKIPVSNMDYTV
jgi:hypothetical protein